MATGVVFGQPRSLLLQPGAYSLVDASALNLPQGFAYNLVVVMGAALGGTPMLPYYLNDPTQATQLFGAETPLSTGCRFAFQGGANGGAPVVIAVRADNCAQASGTLSPTVGASLSATFNDYGAYGNTYSIAFYPGSIQGAMAVIQGSFLDGRAFYQKIDNETSFSNLIARINRESPINLEITDGGAKATQVIQLATSQTDGRASLKDAQQQTVSTQSYCYQYPASMLANTTDSVVVAFDSVIAWTIASADATANTFTTAAAHTLTEGHLIKFSGTVPAEVDTAKVHVVRDISGLAFKISSILAAPVPFAVSSITTATNLFTAPGHTLVNGDVVKFTGVTLPGGINPNQLYFVNSASGNDFKVATTSAGTAQTITGTILNCAVVKVAGAAVDITTTTVAGDTLVLKQFGVSNISNSVPSDFNGTRTPARVQNSYTKAISACSVSASAYTSDSARFTLAAGDSWGNVTNKGLPGSVFTIATGIYAGTYQILYYEWDGYAQDRTRIVRKVSGDRQIVPGSLTATLTFYPVVQFPKAQPANASQSTQLPGYGSLAAGGHYITIVVDNKTVYYSTLPGDTIENVAQYIASQINQSTEMSVVAAAVYNPGTYTATITLTAKTPGILQNQQRVQVLVNQQTLLLATAGGTTLAGGVDPAPPQNTNGEISGAIILAGGYDSAPTYQRWLDALESIKYIPCRWIVPLTDNLGVQMATADHCTLMSSTPKRRERMAVMGHGLGWTPQMVRERAETFQSERSVFCSPGFLSADQTVGSTRMYPAIYSAAVVAGMLAAEGNGITDPITHTYMRNTLRLEYDYKPGSIELDRMIESGVLTLERDPALTRPSRGFRVTRAITTWRVSVNSAYKSNIFESISILNQSDYVAARVREMEESIFIGQAIYPDTLEQIRMAVNMELQRHTRERTIYGYEQKFTKVALNADSRNAVDVTYKIYPAPALEFILNSQLLFPIPDSESSVGGV